MQWLQLVSTSCSVCWSGLTWAGGYKTAWHLNNLLERPFLSGHDFGLCVWKVFKWPSKPQKSGWLASGFKILPITWMVLLLFASPSRNQDITMLLSIQVGFPVTPHYGPSWVSENLKSECSPPNRPLGLVTFLSKSLVNTDGLILKFMQKGTGPGIATTILEEWRGRVTMQIWRLLMQQQYSGCTGTGKGLAQKPVEQNRELCNWPTSICFLTFDEGTKAITWRKDSLSSEW